MNNVHLSALFVVGCAMLTGCTSETEPSNSNGEASTTAQNKEIVLNLLNNGLAKGDRAVIEQLVAEDYRQHNPAVADGRQGLLDYVASFTTAPSVYRVHRVFAEGPLVMVHNEVQWDTRLAIFDLFRVENGQIVEHWDGIQEHPEMTASGRSMFDGATDAEELDNTAANKALVLSFVDDVLKGNNPDKLPTYYDGDKYLQHDPLVPDGASGLAKTLEGLAAQGITLKYEKVHQTAAEGNFVFLIAEGTLGDQHYAFYDLFRTERGKIAEHWDVVMPVPTESKNDNGLF